MRKKKEKVKKVVVDPSTRKEKPYLAVISIYPERGQEDYLGRGIKLKVKSTHGDWRRLAEFIKDKPDAFVEEFSGEIRNIISKLPPSPYIEDSSEAAWYEACKNDRKKPRGKHKKVGWLEKIIKRGVGELWSLFSYYHKKKPHEQPEYFRKLKNIAKKNGYIYENDITRYLLLGLVLYCIEKRYGGFMASRGMKRIDKDYDSFYQTYIVNNSYKNYYRSYPVVKDEKDILAEHASFLTRKSFWQKHQ